MEWPIYTNLKWANAFEFCIFSVTTWRYKLKLSQVGCLMFYPESRILFRSSFANITNTIVYNIKSPVSASPQTFALQFLVLFYFGCSQNYWIDWISAAPCFKRLVHTGVWTFARFVRPLLATILCTWEIWSGFNNRAYMYHVFHWCHRTDLKTNLSPETFFLGGGPLNWSMNVLRLCMVAYHYWFGLR